MSARRDATVSSLRRTILIVEDDPETRLFYSSALESNGFQTEQAHNGHQALEKARDFRPNAVLTDLNVPGMTGVEFCRALQQSASTRAIPILAVTGHSEYLDQPDRFVRTGIAHVLIKPCPPDVIVTALRRLINGGASATPIS